MEITGTPGLPVGFTYWYEAENGKEYIIKIKEITEQAAALEWVKQLCRCSFAMWRVDKPYRQGFETLFRKHFRCRHSGGHSLPRDTRCKASMNIRILRTTLIDEWPCIAQFRGEHNHEVGAPFSLNYHPITEDMQNEILALYDGGYHPYTAYTTYCKEKLSQLGLDSWAFFADRYIFPTKEDFQILWKKHVRDIYMAKCSEGKERRKKMARSGDFFKANDGNDDGGGIDVSEIDEEYFGKRMIDETNDRLDIISVEEFLNNEDYIPKQNSTECTIFENSKSYPADQKKGTNCNSEPVILLLNVNDATDNNDAIQNINHNSMANGKKEIESVQALTVHENLLNFGEVETHIPITVDAIENCHPIFVNNPNESSLYDVLEKIKPVLSKMSRKDLEKYCIQKIVEEISAKTATGDLHKLLKSQDRDLEQCRENISSLNKRNKILRMVLTTVCSEQQKMKPKKFSNAANLRVNICTKSPNIPKEQNINNLPEPILKCDACCNNNNSRHFLLDETICDNFDVDNIVSCKTVGDCRSENVGNSEFASICEHLSNEEIFVNNFGITLPLETEERIIDATVFERMKC